MSESVEMTKSEVIVAASEIIEAKNAELAENKDVITALQLKIKVLEDRLRWRKVEDGEMPEHGCDVTVSSRGSEVSTSAWFCVYDGWILDNGHLECWPVTHWRPLDLPENQ